MPETRTLSINPEQLAYWFFRLNGCFIITNFLLHRPDFRYGGNRTDGDLIAIRFPFRNELHDAPQGAMKDHVIFADGDLNGRIQLLLVEVKKTSPNLNPAWLKDKTILQEFLNIAGITPTLATDEVAQHLFKSWNYTDDKLAIRVMVVSAYSVTPTPEMPLPINQQLTWNNEILPFIHDRFNKFKRHKAENQQWDKVGRILYKLATRTNDYTDFSEQVLNAIQHYHQGEDCD